MSTPARKTEAPPTNTALMVVAGVFLLIPLVALAAVPLYARDEPRLGGWPFFYWYQMVWVFITAACTSIAYACVKRARPTRPSRTDERDVRDEREES